MSTCPHGCNPDIHPFGCSHGYWPEQPQGDPVDTPPDPNISARLTSAIDQISAAGRDIAAAIVAYHRTLRDGGIHDQEAFTLTQHYQINLINSIFGTNPSEQILRIINDAAADDA